jgi:hypothetical protein
MTGDERYVVTRTIAAAPADIFADRTIACLESNASHGAVSQALDVRAIAIGGEHSGLTASRQTLQGQPSRSRGACFRAQAEAVRIRATARDAEEFRRRIKQLAWWLKSRDG